MNELSIVLIYIHSLNKMIEKKKKKKLFDKSPIQLPSMHTLFAWLKKHQTIALRNFEKMTLFSSLCEDFHNTEL